MTRRTPHCAGCGEPILWRLTERNLLYRQLVLFFHRRCAKSYDAGNDGSALAEEPDPND